MKLQILRCGGCWQLFVNEEGKQAFTSKERAIAKAEKYAGEPLEEVPDQTGSLRELRTKPCLSQQSKLS